MDETTRGATTETGTREPTLEQLADALAHHVRANGALRAGVATQIASETGWTGRLMAVLAVLTEDEARMGYLAGGRKPTEVMTWVPLWADAPLTVDQIRAIVTCGGWDPEPFAVIARHGLLERLLYRADGSVRRVRGELAGGWLSDQFALADDDQVLDAVRTVIAEEGAPQHAGPGADSGHQPAGPSHA